MRCSCGLPCAREQGAASPDSAHDTPSDSSPPREPSCTASRSWSGSGRRLSTLTAPGAAAPCIRAGSTFAEAAARLLSTCAHPALGPGSSAPRAGGTSGTSRTSATTLKSSAAWTCTQQCVLPSLMRCIVWKGDEATHFILVRLTVQLHKGAHVLPLVARLRQVLDYGQWRKGLSRGVWAEGKVSYGDTTMIVPAAAPVPGRQQPCSPVPGCAPVCPS
jgi:hypothetical protein